MLLGSVYLRKGDSARSRDEFLIAQKLLPNDFRVNLQIARTYAIEKKWADVEKEYGAALRLAPQDAGVWSQYSDYLIIRGQGAQAVAKLKKYVSDNQKDGQAHFLLGTTYFRTNDYPNAIAELEQSIQLNPNLLQAYLALGSAYQKQGNADVALQRYQQALKLQPNLVPLLTLMGNLYLHNKDYPSARKYYEKALSLDPNFPLAAANLAWLSTIDGGNLDVALGLAQHAKQTMPELPSITDTLGWVEYKKGSYSSSIPLFQECIQQSPDSPEYHFHLGMALVATGDSAKAKTELNAALHLKLEGDEADQARQALARLN